jgi:hypothetical protein
MCERVDGGWSVDDAAHAAGSRSGASLTDDLDEDRRGAWDGGLDGWCGAAPSRVAPACRVSSGIVHSLTDAMEEACQWHGVVVSMKL